VPSYALGYAAAGALLAGALAAAAVAARRGGGGARAAFGALAGAWALLTGVLGTALLLAGTVTKHVAYMGRNWNLLGINPLSLVLLVLVAAAVVGRAGEARRRRARRAERVAAVVAAMAVAGAAAVLLPGAGQLSGELFALLVPAHLAVWWGLARLARGGAPARAAAGAG
jgi:hypothetical protein